jgi:hypothetical protein
VLTALACVRQVDEAIKEALAEARAELPLEEEVEEVEGRPQ